MHRLFVKKKKKERERERKKERKKFRTKKGKKIIFLKIAYVLYAMYSSYINL